VRRGQHLMALLTMNTDQTRIVIEPRVWLTSWWLQDLSVLTFSLRQWDPRVENRGVACGVAAAKPQTQDK